jgi:hypothetical protein
VEHANIAFSEEFQTMEEVLKSVATPLWAKCEDETHTPKSGDLESSGTPKNCRWSAIGH